MLFNICLRFSALFFVFTFVFGGGPSEKGKVIGHEADKYSERANTVWHDRLTAIELSLANHSECGAGNCGCHQHSIDRDLEPFNSTGITRSMTDQACQRNNVLYQIIDHRIYRHAECMFEFRCRGIEYFLHAVKHHVPDVEFVVNTRDWPMVPKHQAVSNDGVPLPVFSFSKIIDQHSDIMYPAWSFWQGGPAIGLYPTGLGRWDQHLVSLTEAAEKWPWSDKLPLAFFRGSRTSDERDSLVLLSRKYPLLVDAAYTKNQAWKSAADTLGAPAAEEVSLEQHCRYKYLFNYHGVAASFRFKHLFLCGSLVFHVGHKWQEFFYEQMRPWIHYIPLPSNPTEAQLLDIIEFAQSNDAIVKEIAVRGRQFVLDNLRMQDITCYWRRLLRQYAKLLQYRPELRPNVSPVPDRE